MIFFIQFVKFILQTCIQTVKNSLHLHHNQATMETLQVKPTMYTNFYDYLRDVPKEKHQALAVAIGKQGRQIRPLTPVLRSEYDSILKSL